MTSKEKFCGIVWTIFVIVGFILLMITFVKIKNTKAAVGNYPEGFVDPCADNACPPVPLNTSPWPRTMSNDETDICPQVLFKGPGCTEESLRKEILRRKVIAAVRDEDFPRVETETALRIALCESNFDQYATNSTSSAKGLYQFTDTTWAAIHAESHQFDADASIKQFLLWYPVHPEWWVCK